MQKGLVFIFANYLADVLVWNYAMGWFRRGMEMAGPGFISACSHVLNLKLPEIKASAYRPHSLPQYGKIIASKVKNLVLLCIVDCDWHVIRLIKSMSL